MNVFHKSSHCNTRLAIMVSKSPNTNVHILPELVPIIVGFLQDDIFALGACISVNRHWSSEAVQLLYRQCGLKVSSPENALVKPKQRRRKRQKRQPILRYRHLLQLTSTLGRLQYYANYVESMCIRCDDVKTSSDDRNAFAARFDVFKKAQFPRLQLLWFDAGLDDTGIPACANDLLTYARKNRSDSVYLIIHGTLLPHIKVCKEEII